MTKKAFLFLAVFFTAQLVCAQKNADSMRVNLNELDVNAYQQQLKTGTGRALTVIDRVTIQRLPVQSLDDLLDVVAGVDVRQRGVGGTQSDISVRGGSFDQVLVLLNGVNITDPQTGHYNLDIPVELSDVSRIELLQGSAARLYGPNAFSGAINIITEKSATKSLSAQLTAGSYNTYTQHFSGNIGNKTISSFNSVSNKTSGGYIPNTDYHIINAFSHTTLNAGKAGKFDLQLAYQQKSYGANAFYSFKYPAQFDHTQTFFGALSWLLHLKNVDIQTQGYARRHYDRFELFRDSIKTKPVWYVGHNYHLTDVLGAKSTAIIQTGIGRFVAGVDVRNEHIFSTVLGNALTTSEANIFEAAHPFTKQDNRLISTVNVDYSKKMDRFNAAAGIAVTHTAKFGTFTNAGADISYAANDALGLYVSANSAVRLPTFTDLYYKSAIQLANPDLKPEKSTTFETGLKYRQQQLSINGSVYYRLGNNIIDWVKVPTASVWESKNLTDVNALGGDIQIDYRLKIDAVKRIGLAYSYLTINKDATTFDSKYALDYLRNKIVLSVEHSFVQKLTALWKLSYNDRAGNYTDFASSQPVSYAPYTMLDLRLLWSEKHFDIFADGNNLFNVSYADYGGLTQPGINFNAGVRFRL